MGDDKVDAGVDKDDSGEGKEDAGNGEGDAGDDKVDAGDDKDDSGEGKGDAGDGKADAGDDKDDSGEDKGDAGEGKGDAGDGKGDAGDDKGDAGDDKDDSGEDKGDAGDGKGDAEDGKGDVGDGKGDAGPPKCSFDAPYSKLECEPNKVTLTVPYCAFVKANFDVSSAYIGGDDKSHKKKECLGTLFTSAGKPYAGTKPLIMLDGEEYESADPTTKPAYVKYEFESGQCGISTSSDETNIFYEGVLFGQVGIKTGVISRQQDIDIPLKCDFSKDLTISVDNFFTPLISSVNVALESVSSEFDVEMSLYADSEMKKILNEGHEISVPDPVYAKVAIQEVDFNVQLKKCWATPSPNPADKTSFVFIDDFKPSAGSMEVTANCDKGPVAAFWIESFIFSDLPAEADHQVYLHCDIHLCDGEKGQDCSCGNGNVRKRRALMEEAPHATLKVGPINFIV